MLQESRLPRSTFYKYSRSISQRSSLSWITTRNRMVRTKLQRVGWTCKRRSWLWWNLKMSYTRKCYVSPRPPPTISYKDNWTCDLDSDIARTSNDIQRIELKPNTQLSSTVRPVCGQESTKEIEEREKFGHDTLSQEKHDEVTNSTSTEKPVTVDQKEEHKIDFRVPGLSHAVVKEAEHLRVQELVKKIETHPHRAALHADLQQNNVYNPFNKDSKEMIRELGNVESFELCETTPNVQCAHCLLYWNQGIVYCTCGQCLIYSESRRNF